MTAALDRRTFLGLLPAVLITRQTATDAPAIGAPQNVGPRGRPKVVSRLVITRPGVYENYVVDCQWQGGNRVKITADNVILRHCEIRNASGNGIGVFGRNVRIEHCHIHHMLAGTFSNQRDAHGITGGWYQVVIRHCNIHHVSGDCIQFDPDRTSRGRVLIENCTLWTGPLPEAAAGFQAGERPGENAVDTKTPPPTVDSPRCELVIRRCYCHGWNQPAQITNCAALNIKEHVRALIEECVFRNNEICFRLRGPGKRGGALVTIRRCAVYDSKIAIRMEDRLRNLTVTDLYVGPGVRRLVQQAGKRPFPGFRMSRPRKAPPIDELLRRGFGH